MVLGCECDYSMTEKHWEPSKRRKARSRDINEIIYLQFAIWVCEDFAVEVQSKDFLERVVLYHISDKFELTCMGCVKQS